MTGNGERRRSDMRKAGDSEGAQVLAMRGLRPDNPLGFLAALGSLRTLSDLDPAAGWELSWSGDCAEIRRRDGGAITEDGVAGEIAGQLGGIRPPLQLPYPMKGDKDKHREAYRAFHKCLSLDIRAAMKNGDMASARRLLDFKACIACYNPHSERARGRTADKVVENQFRMVTGNTTLFNTVSRIIDAGGARDESIRSSLFEPWAYTDDGYSLNWDPNLAGRNHATAPSAPESAFNPSVHGANRVAFEALSLYPVVDNGKAIQTVGWIGATFTWPVWDGFAGLDEVRGILSTRYEEYGADERAQMGIKLYTLKKISIDSGGKQKRLTSARLV